MPKNTAKKQSTIGKNENKATSTFTLDTNNFSINVFYSTIFSTTHVTIFPTLNEDFSNQKQYKYLQYGQNWCIQENVPLK